MGSKSDVLFPGVHFLRDFPNVRFAVQAVHERVARAQRLIRQIAQGAAHADGVVVAQIAADFADDHRHGIGGKAHAQLRVEIVDGLDQADAAHLKEVVHTLAPVVKALDHAEHEPEVPLYEFMASAGIARADFGKQLPHALVVQHGERRCIHAADFDLVNRHILTSNEMSIALATAEYAGFNRQKTRRKCYTGRSVEPSCAQMAL